MQHSKEVDRIKNRLQQLYDYLWISMIVQLLWTFNFLYCLNPLEDTIQIKQAAMINILIIKDNDSDKLYYHCQQYLQAKNSKMKAELSEHASSPKINIQAPILPQEDGEYELEKDKGRSLVFNDGEMWEWQADNQGVLRRSNTQILPTEEEDLLGTDLGCEWANWNINKINIRPSVRLEEPEDLFVPHRLKKRTSRSLEKEVGSPRKARKQSKVIVVQTKQNEERMRRRAMINRVLAGKGSFVWIFILGRTFTERDLEPIKNLYEGHLDNDYVSPLCRSYQQALKFLKMQNHFFKIITDLEHSKQVVQQSTSNASIMAIYLYSSVREKNSDLFELKRQSRKVKGVFLTLNEAANQVSQDIAEEAKFIDINGSLQSAFKPKYRFPSFMVLSGTDNTEVTAYRMCLYSAIKLEHSKDKKPYLQEFVQMIEARYADDRRQLNNLQDYKRIDLLGPNTPEKAEAILRFYVRQTFYYATVNCLLRLARSPQQFHPCTLPFNETYHAIRYYHSLLKNQPKSFKAYRGTKLRQSQVQTLAKGCYIQLLGFASSSLQREVALRFMDQDSYLIEIIVEQTGQSLSEQDSLYQHGYVDINRFQLATDSYQTQREVLFNALNVYKVVDIDMNSAIRTITIKYAAIRELNKRKKDNITPKEKGLLANMAYCIDQLNKIQDYGDLMLLSQEHDKAQQFYLEKLKENNDDPNAHGKLARIESQMGDLKKAEKHALAMLQLISKNEQAYTDQNTTLYQSTESAAELLSMVDNVGDYENIVDIQLKMSKNYLQRSKVLLARSQSKIKRGQLQGCLKDLLRADLELETKKQSFDIRRSEIKRVFFLRSLCACYNRQAAQTVQRQRDAQLLSIQQQQINFKAKQEEFYQYKILIEKTKQQYYEKTGEIGKVKQSFSNVRQYFKKLKEKDEDIYPVQAASYCQFQAISSQKSDFSEYQTLMETAIDILKQFDPYHKKIANLSDSLASQRHIRLRNKLVYPEQSDWLNLISSGESNNSTKKRYRDKFSYQEHKQFYRKCRYHYKQAIDITIYHKGKEHPQCLKVENKLAELDYDYSLLKSAEQRVEEITRRKIADKHSEGAKGYLLLAKIALARGQLKRSFRLIEQAENILTTVLSPKNDRSYLIKHPLFAEININKARIFNKQGRHQLALRELDLMHKISDSLVAPEEMTANVFEQKAQVLFCQGQSIEFQSLILKAIAFREKIMGKFNVHNAISYSKLSMYSRLLQDETDALTYHEAAFEIFSKFPSDHPNSWIIHLSNATIYKKTKSPEEITNEVRLCLRIAQTRYSPDHINLIKIQLQVAKLLIGISIRRQALKLYESVEMNLQKQLKLSAFFEQISNESDDEKVAIQKDLKRQLQGIRKQAQITNMDTIFPFSSYSSNVKSLQCILEESKLQSMASGD